SRAVDPLELGARAGTLRRIGDHGAVDAGPDEELVGHGRRRRRFPADARLVQLIGAALVARASRGVEVARAVVDRCRLDVVPRLIGWRGAVWTLRDLELDLQLAVPQLGAGDRGSREGHHDESR